MVSKWKFFIKRSQELLCIKGYFLKCIHCITLMFKTYVIWSEKTRHMVENLYFELLVSCESLGIILFPELFTWISSDCFKSYWCLKVIKNKETQNYDVNFLYFAVSPFATCDGFSQITSHISSYPRVLCCKFANIGLEVLCFYCCIDLFS